MPVHNSEIAAIFSEVADLLEISEANPFRVRAYRNAARVIGGLPRSVVAMLRAGEPLAELPGIGRDLAGKIEQIARTGTLPLLKELESRLPKGLSTLLQLPGLGPKKVRAIQEAFGVTDLKALKRVAGSGKLRSLPGFGEKSERKLLEELSRRTATPARFQLSVAQEIAESLAEDLRPAPGVGHLIIAGSFRRRQETVGDLDILVTCRDPAVFMKRFVGHDEVRKILSHGTTKSSVLLKAGIQVDVRVVPAASYGAALLYFTGSKAHNIELRARALERGLKINEYGVFRGTRRVAGKTEKAIYRLHGLDYIEPELRESQGEVAAAGAHGLPKLIACDDIRGDLHAHTTASDGRGSLEELAEAARKRGYEYLAITDHTAHTRIARGLDARRFARHLNDIERVNARLRGIRLLKSAEVDILENGKLDLPDEILADLDVTVCSIHSSFGLARRRQTERILKAMDHPRFNILGHPTGRLIGRREAYDLDLERVLEAARGRGCFVELNAQPDRLDLKPELARGAREADVKLAISTDAHAVTDLRYMELGVSQARRAWLEASDVLNTRPWKELQKLLRR